MRGETFIFMHQIDIAVIGSDNGLSPVGNKST